MYYYIFYGSVASMLENKAGAVSNCVNARPIQSRSGQLVGHSDSIVV